MFQFFTNRVHFLDISVIENSCSDHEARKHTPPTIHPEVLVKGLERITLP